MKLKRLISGVAAVALVISSLSFSASADLSKKPGEIGYVPYGMRQYSDDFNFTDKPYSLTSGDYYMGFKQEIGRSVMLSELLTQKDKMH